MTQGSEAILANKKSKKGRKGKADSPSHGINPLSPSQHRSHGKRERSEDDEDSEGGDAGPNTEYSFISKQLDAEMRQLVSDYEALKAQNDRRSDLFMRRIRLKHPIFHLLSIAAFKYLMDNGFLFKLRESQTVYKEN